MFCASSVARAVRLMFFFQAEDGIRGTSVTGVQTCALPIWLRPVPQRGARPAVVDGRIHVPGSHADLAATALRHDLDDERSEERREGKSGDLGARRSMQKKKHHKRKDT